MGITPKQVKPLDQVKDEVKKDWSLDEQRTRLAKFTDELVKQLSSGKTLEDLAKEQNTQVMVTEPLKRDGLTVNVLPVAVTQAFALPQGGYGFGSVRRGRGTHRLSGGQGRGASSA